MEPQLLLASNSPRRRKLFSDAGFDFQSIGPDVDERFDVDLTVRELTALNAIRKGMSVARAHPNKIVLSADTLVAIGDQILGKPKDLAEAVAMLRRLSGQIHEVCSAVFICHAGARRSLCFCDISQVRFRRLKREQIDNYFAKVNPLDKAGGYAAQGSGREVIEKIEGSYSNVVGLPMEMTVAALAEFGVAPKIRPVRLGP